jgi:hypothetical protein
MPKTSATKAKSSKSKQSKPKGCSQCGHCCSNFTINGSLGSYGTIKELMAARPNTWRNWLYPARVKLLRVDRWGKPWFVCRNLVMEDGTPVADNPDAHDPNGNGSCHCIRYDTRPNWCRDYGCW